MTVLFGEQACIEPRSLWDQCRELGIPTDLWFGKANRFVVERGIRPGVGLLLLLRRHLDALDLESPHDLVFADSKATIRIKNLSFVHARCIIPGARSGKNSPYLVEVADRRLLLARVPIDRAFNVRSAPGSAVYLTQTLNAGVAWTWAGMTQTVWELMSDLGTWPGLPFSPDGAPEGFTFYGDYALEALGFILDRLRCTLVWDPFADTYSIERVGATDSSADAALSRQDEIRVWDEDWIETNAGRLPQYVRVLFHRQPSPTDGSSPFYALDVADTSPETGVVAGTYALVRDDLAALGATGAPTNAGALASRAAERAADWFRTRKTGEARLGRVYQGAVSEVDLAPGALLRGWAAEDRGRATNGGGTRISVVTSPRQIVQDWAQPEPGLNGGEPPPPLPTGSALVYKTECEAGINKRYKSWIYLDRFGLHQSDWLFDSNQGCCACLDDDDCNNDPAVFVETDPRCEDGYLNIYERVVQVKVVDGCLTNLVGSWYFSHNAGCCDCGDPPPSGSGSGECVPGICEECYDPPESWELDPNSFTGQCEPFNRHWSLASSGSCIWYESFTLDGVPVSAEIVLSGGTLTLTFLRGPAGNIASAVYTADLVSGHDCCATVFFEPASGGCSCDDVPVEAGDECVSCDGVTPLTWSSTLSDFTGCYDALNGSRVLTQSATPCLWQLESGDDSFSLAIEGGIITVTLWPGVLGPGDPTTAAVYTATFDGNCCHPVTLTLFSVGDCGEVPLTVTFTPSCGDPSSGDCPDTIAADPVCCNSGGGCCDPQPADTLNATITNLADCACVEPSSPVTLLTDNAITWEGLASFGACGMEQIALVLWCSGTTNDPQDYRLDYDFDLCGSAGTASPNPGAVCVPLELEFDLVIDRACCAGSGSATIRVTITE